jgi:N-methylhydantoinase B
VTTSAEKRQYTLDPVTFEVLKNAFVTIVDQMAEQILRTCYSFVIYARDFSSALCDRDGNTIMQGSQDIAVHVGTLHFTCKAVIEAFEGDIHPGDVFAVNDPYVGGTHFNDVRIVRPIFYEGEIIAYAQSNGHWADVGGSVPGSFDVTAKEHFAEGIRVPPVRIWDQGRYRNDVVRLIVSNTRVPADAEGDLHAQASATKVAEGEILRLVDKYGIDTVTTAFQEVQDYVERLTRQRVAELPDGTWETEDYIDYDPSKGEGLIPVKVKMTIEGDQLSYDLTGSHPAIGSFINAGFGSAFSGVIAGTKTFFPDVPLNSGFYRAVEVDLGPVGSVVNAPWPIAVTGFCSGPYEKIMNSIFELWSGLRPERALACSFNLEYLLVGGRDARREERPIFMWYDWMVGGWGGRNGKDGSNATAPIFGVGLAVQPLEAQERLCPVLTTGHEIRTDSGGPGRFRGGCGVEKGAVLREAEATVMSYMCDRARSITWGIEGGLPSIPHGVWLTRDGEDAFLGAVFSNVPCEAGDRFTRPSAGGGGFGDPLERDPAAVREDVADGYVSLERARKDYGVVVREVDAELAEYEVDEAETAAERERIRAARRGWLEEDAASVAERYRSGELDQLDVIRRHGVVLDWGTGELLPHTTEQFRAMLQRRMVPHWA